MDDVPPLGPASDPVPQPAPLPPVPGEAGAAVPDLASSPAPSRTPLWIGLAVAVLVVVLIVVFVATRGGGSSDFPDEMLGLPRLHTDQIQAFEEAMGSLKFGDVTTKVAAYGSGEDATVIVFTYDNLPADVGTLMDGMFTGAGNGIANSGGSFSPEQSVTRTTDGIEYRCAPFSGQLFPSSPTSDGVMCAWAQADREAALLMDVETSDPQAALDHAAAVHDALG